MIIIEESEFTVTAVIIALCCCTFLFVVLRTKRKHKMLASKPDRLKQKVKMGNTNTKPQLYNPENRAPARVLRKEWASMVIPEDPCPPTHLRKWVQANENNNNDDSYQFRVVQYNILAPVYAGVDRYHYCNPKLLHWGYRYISLFSFYHLL
eukprot:TRINITY_DN3755_c0_g1_i1.p1 TRINITY_DN3755_c0_g1~~TRINITY_DN3755_c0_g1_i1.p1  ORF type:complete len:151 (-),score=21.12 TRINITY_DN3755_c0_g1_i1:173-625(-)